MRALTLLTLFLFATSCLESGTQRDSKFGNKSLSSGNNCPAGQNCSIPGDGGLGGGDEDGTPRVEIRGLITPDTGSFRNKLTIPKNYNGKLYLAGLNFNTLTNKFLKVRFNLGLDREPITIDAVVSSAPGLTPSTSTQLLVMDLSGRPFEDVRLLYDLYDYEEYDFSDGDEPISDNKNGKLFCRGLRLDDDPTFTGSDGVCDGSDDICKYAYAKVFDQSLHNTVAGFATYFGLEPQIQSGDDGYFRDSFDLVSKRCLTDNPDITTISPPYTIYDRDPEGLDDAFLDAFTFGNPVTDDDGGEYDIYEYRGPYFSSDTGNWEISGGALYNINNGLFESMDVTNTFDILSYKFPRWGTLNLPDGIEYFGTLAGDDPDAEKSLQVMVGSGTSRYVDGCNIRAQSYNSVTNEHIGSCNISARIEILEYDPSTGAESVIAGLDGDDGGRAVKLQLVRDGVLTNNENVLFSSFNYCSSNSQCGSDECCFNGRCWSRAIVSQCIDDDDTQGNKQVGELCSSDLECSTFCCNTNNRCGVHDTTLEEPVLCNKPYGSQCITSEWCAQTPVVEYYKIQTGTDANGFPTCRIQGYNRMRFGDCLNGICQPPETSNAVIPDADVSDCSNAVPPPTE